MMEEPKNQTGWVDALDQKLFDAFPGRVVRKDLVKRFKVGDKLRVAMDSGARRVMIPTANRKDFATLPDEMIDKMQIEFYSDPAQAAFKALAEG